MTRIKKLTLALIGLVIVSGGLYSLGNRGKKTTSFDKNVFTVADPSGIKRIVIESQKKKTSLSESGDDWQLNDKYKIDPTLIQLIHTILSRVEVQRKVSPLNFQDIKNDILAKGKKVTLFLENGNISTFYVGGNAEKTIACFGDENLTDIYIVAIPGYASYLSGIFELTPGQWRDRMLFTSTWRTLQRLEIDYAEETRQVLSIFFDKKFLTVQGISALDTALLMDYLAPLEYFQLNDYLEKGAFPRYDSLINEKPLAKLVIEDIDKENNRTLNIYPKIPEEQFYLLSDADNQMIVVDELRMKNLLVTPSKFRSAK